MRRIFSSHCATAAEFGGTQLSLSYPSYLPVQPGDPEGSQEFWDHSGPSQTATSGGRGQVTTPCYAERVLISCRQNPLPPQPHPGRGCQTPDTN